MGDEEELDIASLATTTVSELVKELGSEQAAMTHIVAYNIKLRMAAADVITAWDECSPYMRVQAINALRSALDGKKSD